MISSNQTKEVTANYRGTDKLLTGIDLAVVTFWLFAQTTLNIAPVMSSDLNGALIYMNCLRRETYHVEPFQVLKII